MSVCEKSSTLNSKRLASHKCEGISEAVAKVQPGRMPAASAKVAVGLAGDPCLRLGNGFDDQLRLIGEIVKTAAGDGITASVDDDRGFEEAGGRHSAMGSGLDGSCISRGVRLIAEDRDESR